MTGGFATVVIPAYGRAEKLRKAIRSVLAQDLEPERYEVIVVDSSPDETNAAVVAELQAEARCPLRVFRKPPEGPGPSRNLGAREGRGSFIAFMDSDCQASPGWLRAGLAAFEPEVGLVQGRTLPEEGVPHSVFNLTLRIEHETFLYETANILYRREAFEQAGGFLSDMNPRADKPMGGEDVDLAWKVKRAGWRSRFAPEALVRHEVVRVSPWRWLVDKRMYVCPRIVRHYPELRRFFYARYFFDRVQAALVLALLGAALALPLTPFTLLLALPYVAARSGETSRTLRGPLRLLRVLLYLPRDSASLALLLAGSVRYRALLL